MLGLVEREVLLDLLQVVADEDAPRVFDIAGRLVESGHDLRHVCRELARLVRDLMVLQVDPDRTSDPEFGIEGDGDRLRAIASRFSREDLLRAFELVAKLEQDVKVAAQPRFHLEMALLRWVHLRKLVPLAALLDGSGGGAPAPSLASRSMPVAAARPTPAPAAPRPTAPAGARPAVAPPSRSPAAPATGPGGSGPATSGSSVAGSRASASPVASAAPAAPASAGPSQRDLLVDDVSETALVRFRDAFLAEVKRSRGQADWGMIFGPAKRVDVAVGSVAFVYETQPKLIATRFEALRPELAVLATALAGRPMTVGCKVEAGPAVAAPSAQQGEKDRLKAAALAEPAVQALLDVYPADIRDVEEVKE